MKIEMEVSYKETEKYYSIGLFDQHYVILKEVFGMGYMKIKKIIYMGLSFFIPIICFLAVMYFHTGTIDGNYIMISDMGAQYTSLFQYLKNVLSGSESLFYSFHKGLGGEMFTAFTYYLSSPLNLLTLLFKDGNLPNAILLIILIKLGLTGLTMNTYLNYKKYTDLKMNLIFSLCYALMGYTVNYYFNIMWLDAVYMLPLVVLGLDKIIEGKNPFFYIIFLAYTIICNYYTGYMVCLFSLLYFIYQIVILKRIDKKIAIRFIVSSLLSVGISSFILIPTILKMSSFASTQGDIDFNLSYLLSTLKGIIENLIIGGHGYSYLINPYGVYLYVGNFCFLLCILFLTNKKIDKGEKMINSIFIGIFLLSFIIKSFVYIWHGFSLPAYFNNRHAFLLNFFIIILGVRFYARLNELTKRNIIIVCIVYIVISGFSLMIQAKLLKNIIITGILLILYMYIIKERHKVRKGFSEMILLVTVVIEMLLNLHLSYAAQPVIVNSYNQYIDTICPIVAKNDLSFRTENGLGQNAIDGLTCSYNSMSTFLSTITEKDIKFFSSYGYPSGSKVFLNKYNNMLMDSLLGIRYYYLDSETPKSKWLKRLNVCNTIPIYDVDKEIVEDHEYCLYENESSLSIGYTVDSILSISLENVFENQNSLLKLITGIEENAFTPLEYIQNQYEYQIRNNGNNFYLYISFDTQQEKDKIKLYANGEQVYDAQTYAIVEISSTSNITNIKIENDSKKLMDHVEVYQLDEAVVKDTLRKKYDESIKITSVKREKLAASVEAKQDGYVLFTIPYDSNLKVLVDGVQVDIVEVLDYLIEIPITEGTHEIQIIYSKKIYYLSGVLSILFGVFAILFVKKCKKSI